MISVIRWFADAGADTQVYGFTTDVDEFAGDTLNKGQSDGVDETETDDTETDHCEGESELCHAIYENDPEILVLVNKENELDVDYNASLHSICKGRSH
jgi:hypothetical protein